MLKRVLVLCFCAVLGLTFSACSSNNVDEKIDFPWGVVLVLKYELNGSPIMDATLKNIDDYLEQLVDGKKGVETSAWKDNAKKVLQIEIYFEDYQSFISFNKIDAERLGEMTAVKNVTKEYAYTIKRSLTFVNPWQIIYADRDAEDAGLVLVEKVCVMIELETYVRAQLTGALTITENTNPTRVFAFESSYRRSSVPAAYKHDNNLNEWVYYIKDDQTTITIYDTFANQALWYVTGLGAAIVFSVAIYLLYNYKRRKIDVCRSQSLAESTEI